VRSTLRLVVLVVCLAAWSAVPAASGRDGRAGTTKLSTAEDVERAFAAAGIPVEAAQSPSADGRKIFLFGTTTNVTVILEEDVAAATRSVMVRFPSFREEQRWVRQNVVVYYEPDELSPITDGSRARMVGAIEAALDSL
jgi:hypothetical protein